MPKSEQDGKMRRTSTEEATHAPHAASSGRTPLGSRLIREERKEAESKHEAKRRRTNTEGARHVSQAAPKADESPFRKALRQWNACTAVAT